MLTETLYTLSCSFNSYNLQNQRAVPLYYFIFLQISWTFMYLSRPKTYVYKQPIPAPDSKREIPKKSRDCAAPNIRSTNKNQFYTFIVVTFSESIDVFICLACALCPGSITYLVTFPLRWHYLFLVFYNVQRSADIHSPIWQHIGAYVQYLENDGMLRRQDQCDKFSTFCVERDILLQALLDFDLYCASLQLILINLKQEDNHGKIVKGWGNGGGWYEVNFDCVNRICAIRMWNIEHIVRDKYFTTI